MYLPSKRIYKVVSFKLIYQRVIFSDVYIKTLTDLYCVSLKCSPHHVLNNVYRNKRKQKFINSYLQVRQGKVLKRKLYN